MRYGFRILSTAVAAIISAHCASAPGTTIRQTIPLDGGSTQIVAGCSPSVEYIGYDLLVRNAALQSDREHALNYRVLKVGMDVGQMHTIKKTIEDLRSRIAKICALNEYTAANKRCRGARNSLYEVFISLANDLNNARTAGEVDGAMTRATTKANAINEVEACR